MVAVLDGLKESGRVTDFPCMVTKTLRFYVHDLGRSFS